jgi:hypothetical protein
MQGQNIRKKVQIVISGAFNNKSVHFVGVINCVIVNMHGRTTIKTTILNLLAIRW